MSFISYDEKQARNKNVEAEASTRFDGTYTKIGTTKRKLAWPLHKDDTQNREAFYIFLLASFSIIVNP